MLRNDCVSISLVTVRLKLCDNIKRLGFRIVRNQLLEGDFSANIKLLQNFPPMDVQIILSRAVELSKRKMF